MDAMIAAYAHCLGALFVMWWAVSWNQVEVDWTRVPHPEQWLCLLPIGAAMSFILAYLLFWPG